MQWLQKYSTVFDAIEHELKQLGLWSEQRPSPEALASTMPFCVDTLSFEQWLQFVFLAKMRTMVLMGKLPPGPAQIAPIGEEAYKERKEAKNLLKQLAKFDEISYLSHVH